MHTRTQGSKAKAMAQLMKPFYLGNTYNRMDTWTT